jgi:hypothetical protein
MGFFITQEIKQMIDNALILKDAGEMTASGHCTVNDSAKTIDLGTGTIDGKLVVHVLSAKHSIGNESYKLALEVCENADFTGDKLVIGNIDLSPVSENALSGIDKAPIKITEPFTNVPYKTGVSLRHCRLYATLAGTAPSINFTAYLVK